MVREKFRFRKGRCARLGDYFSFSEKTLPCFARKSNEFGGATVLARFSFFLTWQLTLLRFRCEGTSDDERHVPCELRGSCHETFGRTQDAERIRLSD